MLLIIYNNFVSRFKWGLIVLSTLIDAIYEKKKDYSYGHSVFGSEISGLKTKSSGASNGVTCGAEAIPRRF